MQPEPAWCGLCAGDHQIVEHKCSVVDCKGGRGECALMSPPDAPPKNVTGTRPSPSHGQKAARGRPGTNTLARKRSQGEGQREGSGQGGQRTSVSRAREKKKEKAKGWTLGDAGPGPRRVQDGDHGPKGGHQLLVHARRGQSWQPDRPEREMGQARAALRVAFITFLFYFNYSLVGSGAAWRPASAGWGGHEGVCRFAVVYTK